MRVAVVGTGIAGLGAAYALSRVHDVELYERNPYAGGHTHTIAVGRPGGELALDTGFIVMNERNYPALTRLLRELGIRTQDSDMSFSVSCRRCGLEYAGRRPLAQPRNVLDPRFRRLLADIVRFLRTARTALDEPRSASATLAEFVAEERYSRAFVDHYLVPLTSAIWSTAPTKTLDFPAVYAVRFFEHHGMLGFRRRRWTTVCGGSREYVRALLARMGAPLKLRTPVVGVARDVAGVELRLGDGSARRCDRVVIATHADEALALLADPSADEQRLLGAFSYTTNETVLHTDERFLPRAEAARASWNYQIDDCRSPARRPTMTYYLNRLQALDEPMHYCVTLNRTEEIREDRIVASMEYDHPLYTFASLRAQEELGRLAGVRNTAYAGAYHGFGFHEDGLVSGLAAARAFGGRW